MHDAEGAELANNPWAVAEGSHPSCPQCQDNVPGRGAVRFGVCNSCSNKVPMGEAELKDSVSLLT
jgi:ribosomal protein L37AE/L43A